MAIAMALGAREVAGWSSEEEHFTANLPTVPPSLRDRIQEQILAGFDPLGEAFCRLRPPVERRKTGAIFTPQPITTAMVDWAEQFATPERVIDPGIGSARFALAAGRRFRDATILGIEVDPLSAVIARANLSVAGFAHRSKVILGDFRSVPISSINGKTLYIGNPPYVRHHLIGSQWKRWLIEEASRLTLSASQLAGLHVHFFLATVAKAAPGDFGAFITAAEWLDVNYGSLVRDLFIGPLGGQRIVVIEPTALPFPDAATTAAITTFKIGSQPKQIRMKRVELLDDLQLSGDERVVRRERLETEVRWSHLTRRVRRGPAGYVELGEVFRVHRGQVTGANKVWIEGPLSKGLPSSVLFPSITKARELFLAGKVLEDASILRRVIDLPVDLDVFDTPVRREIDRFLDRAKKLGAHQTYIATNRRAWWSVGLRQPAPILATYMARRPPAFVRNRAEARHINIAHGLYPREILSDCILQNLVDYLSGAVNTNEGRTYAGGLTKFEPREMERLLVPGLDILSQGAT
ncbi:N-6 DNA methylase [Tautonia marina]|uniref:N-6 DNA methylase n=1 Tax=Tautonia marina TaxID=2653855 RepID=UPI00191BE9D1|nr:N-6 DNA methylase [Tautonia marina]